MAAGVVVWGPGLTGLAMVCLCIQSATPSGNRADSTSKVQLETNRFSLSTPINVLGTIISHFRVRIGFRLVSTFPPSPHFKLSEASLRGILKGNGIIDTLPTLPPNKIQFLTTVYKGLFWTASAHLFHLAWDYLPSPTTLQPHHSSSKPFLLSFPP